MPKLENRSPILKQVLASSLGTISNDPDFSEELLKRLTDMADSGDLADYRKVITALRTGEQE